MRVTRAPNPTLRRLARILLAALCLLLLALAGLWAREALARRQYLAQYPPQGRMLSLGTHQLCLNCVGSGGPTVLFESDLDQYGSLSWAYVQNAVAQFTRACSYDRAGILWSQPGPLPRDGERIAAELGALLEAAGEQGPYVLVGHAYGGAYARIFAGQNPGAVRGMLLLDSSHPEQFTRFAGLGLAKQIPDARLRPLIWLMSHLGQPGRFQGPRYGLPDEIYRTQQVFLPKSSLAWFDEGVQANATLAQAGRYATLGDLPLIVLASARPSGLPAQGGGGDLQEAWLEMQRELAALSSQGELRPLPESGHYIQYDQPEAVIEAVQDVVRRCSAALPP